MKTTLGIVLRWAAAAAVAGFLVTGWVVLSRGQALSDGRTVIRIWDWWNPAGDKTYAEFFGKVERDFEAAHPDIDVRYQFIPFGTQYIQKLMSAFAAGDPPDAFQCSIIWATDLYDRGVIRDLGDFVATSPDVAPEAYFPACRPYITAGGHTIGIPTSMDAYALLINAEMMREAGLDPSPYAMDSWDRLVEYAQKMTVRDGNGNITRAGFIVSATGEHFSGMLPWMATKGKSFLTDDLRSTWAASPEGLSAMQFMYDLLYRHGVSFPPGSERQDFSMFTERKAAIIVGGTWNGFGLASRAPDLDYVMTSFPPGPNGRRATVTWANMMMMPKKAAHPKETWEYLRYYGGLQVSKDMLAILQRNSARKDFYATPEWAEAIVRLPYLKNVPDICASGATYPYKRFEEVNDVFRPYFQNALLGSAPIEDAMREGNARVETVLRGNWADRILEEERAAREGAQTPTAQPAPATTEAAR